MALVSDLSHSENVVLLKTLLTDSVHGKSLLVEPYQRHLATCTIRSPLLHHHVRSLLLYHCIRRNLLHPLRGSHGASDLVRVRHDNAFSCSSHRRRCTCLSHIASDSVAYASVSVSLSRSCPLTSTGFRSCGVPPGSIPLSSGFATLPICFSAHVSHVALLPEVALASAPVPTCSKILEVCFDVNTVLDDPPINSGGATRSRHCSRDATRTRHNGAVFSHSAQHSFLGQIFCCPRCVLTCMQRFRVWMASVQRGFLLYRWSHCWRACSSSFPGCLHVMLYQIFIDVSSLRRLRDRRRCFL